MLSQIMSFLIVARQYSLSLRETCNLYHDGLKNLLVNLESEQSCAQEQLTEAPANVSTIRERHSHRYGYL